MSDSGKGLETVDRPISLEEALLARWLLEHGEEGSLAHMPQVDKLRVVSKCSCGCPTVYFVLSGNPATRRGERLISDHLGTVDDEDVGVMLFALDGQISSLEVYSCAGSDKPFGLPRMETLKVVEKRLQEPEKSC